MRSLELAIKYLAGDRLQGTAAERAALTTGGYANTSADFTETGNGEATWTTHGSLVSLVTDHDGGYDYVKGNNNHTGTPEQSIAADLGFTCGSSNGKWVLGFDHDVESRNSQGTGDPPDNPLVNFTNADKTADYLPNINGSDTLGIVYNYQNYMRASYHDSSGGNGSQSMSTSTAISTPVASSIVWQYFLLTFDINAGTTKVEEFSTAARTGTPTASYTYTHSKDYDDLDVIVIMGYTGDNASKLYNGKVTNIKVFNNTDNVTTQTQPNLINGTIFEESDTGKHYMFDGTSTWNEMT